MANALARSLARSQEILRYPPTRDLTSPQRDLIWQFRFYLTRDNRALTKFLKSVVWTDPGEVKQAVEVLLPMWSEVEMDDALELLGRGEGSRERRVRGYAVRRVGRADDEVRGVSLFAREEAGDRKADPIEPNPSRNSCSTSCNSCKPSNSKLPPPLPPLPPPRPRPRAIVPQQHPPRRRTRPPPSPNSSSKGAPSIPSWAIISIGTFESSVRIRFGARCLARWRRGLRGGWLR